jgi:hypothetical protein
VSAARCLVRHRRCGVARRGVPLQVWKMVRSEDGAYAAEFLFAISLHNATVNVVRWSPSGEYLVSGSDGARSRRPRLGRVPMYLPTCLPTHLVV